jgi:addiction module RelB/DinJ family antitoxin
MAKTATVQARVDVKKKEQVEEYLDMFGITQSQFINMLYSYVALKKDIPFDFSLREPVYPMVTSEEERQIGESLEAYSRGEYDDVDPRDTAKMKKLFGL